MKYNSKELRHLLSFPKDLKRFGTVRTIDNVDEQIELTVQRINSKIFVLNPLHQFTINNKLVFNVSTIGDLYILRKIDRDLRNIYKPKFSNRNMIVSQVITLLKENIPYTITRLDIRSFYESISYSDILEKIRKDGYLSSSDEEFLINLQKQLYSYGYTGLPRGLSISSVFSEIQLRGLDDYIINIKNVYYYARYVDDIIVMSYDDYDIKAEAEKWLKKKGLDLNNQKSYCVKRTITSGPDTKATMEYLGYMFIIPKKTLDKPKKNKSVEIKVCISQKKISRMKKRIQAAIIDYNVTGNFDLLMMRIKFLTGNYVIVTRTDNSILKGGVFYNNQYIDDSGKEQLKRLDKYLVTAIKAYGNKYFCTANPFSDQQVNILNANSFFKGFVKRTLNEFTRNELRAINENW